MSYVYFVPTGGMFEWMDGWMDGGFKWREVLRYIHILYVNIGHRAMVAMVAMLHCHV